MENKRFTQRLSAEMKRTLIELGNQKGNKELESPGLVTSNLISKYF